ncbi:hypothetical protein [Myroides injenensis]|uniref:hypothetical protein n=1 Tax=Myroides injenensis TaxID=1183151 RepID=UPI002271BF03|nr:hypothetical protein [Myroides injenensis]
MKKLLILGLLGAFMLSCSSDDSNKSPEVVDPNQKINAFVNDLNLRMNGKWQVNLDNIEYSNAITEEQKEKINLIKYIHINQVYGNGQRGRIEMVADTDEGFVKNYIPADLSGNIEMTGDERKYEHVGIYVSLLDIQTVYTPLNILFSAQYDVRISEDNKTIKFTNFNPFNSEISYFELVKNK